MRYCVGVFFFLTELSSFGTPFLGFLFALKNFFRESVVVNARDDDDDDDDEVQHTHTHTQQQRQEGFVTRY